MAAGTLIIAMIFFAARGFFLGLPGVIARLLGLISAYIIAFSYRGDLATLLAARADSTMHPLVLQIISGAVLFFGTMFLVSLLVSGLLKVLTKLIPPLSNVLSKDATAGRITGAVFNSAIGAAIVLTGIWAYGLTLGKDQTPDQLQLIANRFGDSVLGTAQHLIASEKEPSTASSKSPKAAVQRTSTIERGSAEIISSENPEKRAFIEQIQQTFAATSADNSADLQALLNNEQLQQLINDPAVRKKATEYMEANPEQMMEALNNPKFRELLERMEAP